MIHYFKYSFFLLIFPLLLSGTDFEFTTIGNVYPAARTTIGSLVDGRIETIFVDVGSRVKKGEPLLALDLVFFRNDLLQKENLLELAKVELADAEKNYIRMQNLWEKPNGKAPSISLKKFEEAKNKYELALIGVKNAETQLNRAKTNLEEATIKAPYDGIITKKYIEVGGSISAIPASELLEIEKIYPLYLEFSIPQSYLEAVTLGHEINYSIEGTGVKEAQAKIDLQYPALDESTRSLRCRSVIENRNQSIKPGSLAKITIKGKSL